MRDYKEPWRGQQSVVRPGQLKCRTVAVRSDGAANGVRQRRQGGQWSEVGGGVRQRGTVTDSEDCRRPR